MRLAEASGELYTAKSGVAPSEAASAWQDWISALSALTTYALKHGSRRVSRIYVSDKNGTQPSTCLRVTPQRQVLAGHARSRPVGDVAGGVRGLTAQWSSRSKL